MSLEKNLAEMAQGILVSQRHARWEQLQRWERAGKISLNYTGGEYRRQVWLYRGILLAECDDGNDFPTEAFVAQVALGIQALSNFVGVYEPVQWAPA